jgi:hypothetical protein
MQTRDQFRISAGLQVVTSATKNDALQLVRLLYAGLCTKRVAQIGVSFTTILF